jgi:hypothetical protein
MITHEAHTEQRFLSDGNEDTLIQWLSRLGASLRPVCKESIRARAQSLPPENKKPSRNWVHFLKKRHPEITLTSPTGLDPKRAKAFNKPVVNRFFDELTRLIELHKLQVPPENIYNMDEKGCQRSGGKKAVDVKGGGREAKGE